MTTHSVSVPPAPPAVRPDVELGDADGAPGAIALTDRFLTRDGRPWFPVMGEYHFSRDDPANWERELRKMRAGGINVLSTYLLWIVHEEVEGRVRWDGPRDLRRFIRIAADVGLSVVIRIGPWAHGETRNGGFPDWLQRLPIRHRTDDDRYLRLVRGWYLEIAQQVRGLLHSVDRPDGPIIGVQVDNELYDQPEHLATLRDIAEELGIRAPLWMATGWGGAMLPADRLLPVYAGYSDGFWESSTVEWPDFGPMHFTFSSVRDDLSVGADVRGSIAVASERDERYPFVTCELGGGMHVAYHRRPLVDPVDVAALALVKLGSGSAWQGYYLYHGATQVIGELTSTQESHDTGYPNDLPRLDYDFFAPIGRLGTIREHHHLLRQQHLLIEAFGARLATYPAVIPAPADGGPRWSVRGDGTSGYLFVNNHQPAISTLPAIDGVQFEVELGGRVVTVPSTPVTLRSGVSFVWPLRQSVGDIPALTATLQPVTQVGGLAVFAAAPGIPPEFLLEGVDAGSLSGGSIDRVDGRLRVIPHRAPGADSIVEVGTTRLLVLDAHTASRVWRGEIAGKDSLVLWDGSLHFGPEFTVFTDSRCRELLVHPALDEASLPPGVRPAGTRGVFAKYVVEGPPRPVADVVVERAASGVNEHRRGGSMERTSGPRDVDFDRAARIRVDIPGLRDLLVDGDRVHLALRWVGDAARAYLDGRLVADQFWSGRPWEIELTEGLAEAGLHVDILALPWDPTAEVFVDRRVRPTVDGPLLAFTSAEVVIERSFRFGRAAGRPRNAIGSLGT